LILVVEPASHGIAGDKYPGYYYYFYPIKSFQHNSEISEMNSQQNGAEAQAPNQMEDNKSVEPLFMAMTGFIGMASMFIVSVLFLPKLGIR